MLRIRSMYTRHDRALIAGYLMALEELECYKEELMKKDNMHIDVETISKAVTHLSFILNAHLSQELGE